MIIYCNISLFAIQQSIFVLKDENIYECKNCPLSDISDEIANLAFKYNINKITLRGNEDYLTEIVSRIKDIANIKYNIYDLQFEVY